MGKVVTLRRARKDRDRVEKAERGTQAAALHGRSKAERSAEAARAEKDAAHLDAHRRDDR